jgi:hypothetical protein
LWFSVYRYRRKYLDFDVLQPQERGT